MTSSKSILSQSGETSAATVSVISIVALLFLLALTAVGMVGCPRYAIYSQRQQGEAELAQATYTKQVAVQEAQAKLQSASLLAQADVERAKGAAQANLILGNSLKGNEAYLRYLWIQSLETQQNKVIYVPTEGNLPILEAGRLGQIAP